jgi:flagellar biosynthesis component FlhA
MGGAVKAVTSVVSKVSSFAGGPWGTIASLAFQGYSMLKQRSQQKKAAAASRAQAEQYKAAEESKARYSQVQSQRARVQAQREARIRHGQILAGMGTSGLGMTGSSSFTGAMGSVSSQLGTNIGDINVGEGFAQEQSQYNIAAASYGQKALEAESRAAGWKQMGTMAENIGGQFGNIFDIEKID